MYPNDTTDMARQLRERTLSIFIGLMRISGMGHPTENKS